MTRKLANHSYRGGVPARIISGAWVKEQKVVVADGKITGYNVNLLVTFVLD